MNEVINLDEYIVGKNIVFVDILRNIMFIFAKVII